MGYTHYWQGTPNLSIDVMADIATIINASDVKLGDWQGRGAPVFSDGGGISLNGWEKDGEDYETFSLGNAGSSFCKTGRMPYDVVVCAILIRVREASPDFIIESDGEWDVEDEWVPARELYTRALGRESILAGLDA